MDQKTIEALIAAFNRPAYFAFDSEHQVMLVPPGYKTEDIRDSLPPPKRIVQRVEVHTPDDFCAYVKRHALSAAVFANEPSATFDGVMDYHLPSPPSADHEVGDVSEGHKTAEGLRGPVDHTVVYSCPMSDEWKVWTAANSRPMTQVDFARFVEENVPDIIQPTAADMLGLALNMEVHKAAKFESGLNLGNGQRELKYVETVQSVAKPGTIVIPSEFTIKIPVFQAGDRFEIKVRFRYRLVEGTLSIWYELVRAAEVHRNAVGKVTEKIRAGLPEEIPVWRGRRV